MACFPASGQGVYRLVPELPDLTAWPCAGCETQPARSSNKGAFAGAMMRLRSAFVRWPLLVVDRGILLGMRQLRDHRQASSAFPTVLPEFDDSGRLQYALP